MPLPDFPAITDDVLRAIVSRYALKATTFSRMPQVGIFNAIFALGEDLILRVPRDHPRFIAAARNEAIGVPLARAAEVRTPALLIFDDVLDLLAVPYSIYERVPGAALEQSVDDPVSAVPVWRELGRDLARLHTGVEFRGSATALIEIDQKTDPRPLPEIIARHGYFTTLEARWLDQWLERLAAVPEGKPRFLHGDSQASNIMVAPETQTYSAVIDWGSCRWGEIANDFSGIPLRAVPAMLDGYREVSVLDHEIEARIVWRHLQIALHQLRGRPQPEMSWAERPIGMLLEILRFFGEEPGADWTRWAPSARG